MSLLDGLLLGDGNLELRKINREKNATYRQACKYSDYLQFVKKELVRSGLTFTPRLIMRLQEKIRKSKSYTLKSHASVILTPQYYRWYKNGVKIVPRDVVLDKETLLHWYLGDGSLDYYREKVVKITMSTNSFSEFDITFLQNKLTELGVRNCRSGKRIQISKSSIENFLGMIGECPVECYKYKWAIDSHSFYLHLRDIANTQQSELFDEEYLSYIATRN